MKTLIRLSLLFCAGIVIQPSAHAQTKLGNNPSVIDPAAILELESPNKALYLTRVYLQNTSDLITIPGIKPGMVVYNTNPSIVSFNGSYISSGVGVYYFDGNGWVYSGVGSMGNSYWGLNGNSNAVDGTNFIGTTNNVALNFRVNNFKSGRIDLNGNTSLGYQAAQNQSIGLFYNTLIGSSAGSGITLGSSNTGVGNSALLNTGMGSRNTAIGHSAGATFADGSDNTFVGYQADLTTSGINNATAIGSGAKVSASNSVVLGNNANVGIGNTAPTNKLHVTGTNPVRVENLTSTTINPDPTIEQVVTTDATGVFHKTPVTAITNNITAGNGLTKTGNEIDLGGTLAGNTNITTAPGKDLNINGTGNLNVTNAVNAGSLDVTNNAVVHGSTTVTGSTTSGSFTTTGATNTGTLAVTTDATIGGTATVTGLTTAGGFTTTGATNTGSLAVTNNASIGGNAAVTGTLGAGATTVSSLHSTGNAIVDGTLNAGNTTVGTLNAAATQVTSLTATGINTGTASNDVLNITSGGVVEKVSPDNLVAAGIHANNGVNVSGSTVKLGGALITPTTVTTDATNTLSIAGLQSGSASDNLVVADPSTGALRQRPLNGVVTANNGLNASNGNVRMGGTLDAATNIDKAGNTLTYTGAGNVGFGTASPNNNVEIQANGIGGALIEENQGLNVLSTSGTNVTQAVSLRGRLAVQSGTIGQARGVSGATNLTGGTVTSTATGGYFNVNATGATLNSGVSITGIAADAEAKGANTLGGDNNLMGARFGANGTLSPTARTIGVEGRSNGSTVNNVGVFGATTTSDAEVKNVLNALPPGLNAGVFAVTATDGANDRALYTNGKVQMVNTPAGAPGDDLVTVDNQGNVRKQPLSNLGGLITADNGLTKTGNNVQLGGPLVQNTNIDQNGKTLTIDNANLTINGNTQNNGDVTTTGNTTTGSLNATTGTITTLNSTTGTIATLNSTNGTITTLGSTTGNITTVNAGTTNTGALNATGNVKFNGLGNTTATQLVGLDVSGNLTPTTNFPAATHDASLVGDGVTPLGINLNHSNTYGVGTVQALDANATQGNNLIGAVNAGTNTVNATRIGNGLTNTQVNDDLTINGGTIDNSPINGSTIGATTPSTGAFTTVNTGTSTATGLAKSGSLEVTGAAVKLGVTTGGLDGDNVLHVDGSGNVTTVSPNAIVNAGIQTANGISHPSVGPNANKVILGGALSEPTTISSTSTNTLTIAGTNNTAGSSALTVTSTPATIAQGTDMFAARNTITGTDGQPTANGSSTTLRAQYNNAQSNGNNVRVNGSLNEASAGGTGLGASNTPQATGVTGLADYTGSGTAPVDDYVVGVRGATYTPGGASVTSGINVLGASFGGAYDKSVGGYFAPTGGTTNIGTVSQIGGTDNAGWKDADLAGKNVSVAAINYNTPGANERAIRSKGAVQMTGLTGAGAAIVTADADGNLGTAANANSLVTVSNGISKDPGIGDVQLGGTLIKNTTVTSGAFSTEFIGSNPASGASVLKATNNAGAVADGADLFAGANFITGSNASAVGTPGVLRAQYNNASTVSNNMRVQGALNEASTNGVGLGANNTAQATGATGLADYKGATPAGANDYLVGLRGATYTSGQTTNAINVAGVTFDGNFNKSVGGYFYPSNGTTNLGSVNQVGGAENDGWKDADFANRNVAVAAVDYANGVNDRAILSKGKVQMIGTPAGAPSDNVVTMDASGNVRQQSISNLGGLITADNGLTKTGNNVQLGGALTQPTTVTSNGANNLVVNANGVGDASPEVNQGLNVLGTSANSTNTAIGLRGRMLIPASSTVATGRGVSGATIVSGTVSGSATGAYFNTNLSGATLGANVIASGVSADAEATGSNPNVTAANAMIGGRFGANATNASNARAVGVLATAGGSNTVNAGAIAVVNDATLTNPKTVAAGVAASGPGNGAAVVAINPNTGANNYAVYSDGNVAMKSLPATGNDALVGIDLTTGKLSTTAIPATITADNGLTKTGSNIQLGGPLTQNTTVAGGNFNTTFTSTNNATGTATLKVQSVPGTVAGGSELFASDNRISATSTGAQTTLRAQYNNAQSSSDNVRVNGSLNEASAGGKGLGASGTPQATGVTGLADYTGATDANATDFIVGVRGAAYTASNKTNGLNVVGMNFGGTYNSSVGGYFYPSNGTSNLGTVSQIGGTDNSAWQDATFAGKNVAVVAMDGSAAAPMTIAGTNRAIYANGNVQLSNLPANPSTTFVGVDANGNLSTSALPAFAGVTTNADNSLSGNGTPGSPLGINFANNNSWTGVQSLPANATQGDNLIAATNAGTTTVNATRIGTGLTNAQVNDNLDIDGGNIINTPIGQTGTAQAGKFSTLESTGAATLNSAAVTNNATVGGTLGVTGSTTLAGLTAGTTSVGTFSSNGGTTLTGIPSSGNTLLLGIDGSGVVSTTAIPATITADNGLTKTGSNIQLGGALTQNTTVAGGNFNTTFTSTNTATGSAVVKVQAAPGAVAGGSELFASDNRISATSTGAQTTLRAQYNNAQSNSNNVRVNGSLNEASAGGTGLGASNTPQATGVTGLADYTGAGTAPVDDYVVGVRGATYTPGGASVTSGINVLGASFGGAYDKSVGGYFAPTGGATNIGTVSQIGGTDNAGWKDADLAGKNVAVAAINYNTPGANERAIRSKGAVQMTGLTGAGASIVTADADGNLGTAANANSLVTVSNGISKDPGTGDVQLGGSLIKNTNVALNSNNLTISNATATTATFRNDGTIAMGNGGPIYADNKMEVRLTNVGGAITSGEQNQGLNVLASANNGAALSVGTRSRLNVDAGNTVTSARALQGNVGVDGTANGGVAGSYFNAVLRTGGTLGANATLSGVSADAEATGGTSAATNSLIGARVGANAANATSARTFGTFSTANNSVTSNIGTMSIANDPAFATFGTFIGTAPAGFGAATMGLNGGNGADKYAGYFTSSNNATGTSAVKVLSTPGAVAGGSELFASDNRISATSTGAQTTLRAQYNNAQSNSDNVRVNGSLNEASAGGKGLGASGTPQATGVTGLADYTGATDANATDFIVGVRGAAYTASNKTNGLNVVGMNFGGTYNSSVGGYFYPSNGTSNLGTVSQVGGTENSAWQDATFAGKNVAVVAMDGSAAAPMTIAGTNRAIYANGNVQLSNLPATGNTALVGIDANGNLSTTSIPATITASNGAVKVGNDIQVDHAFSNTFTASQTFSGGAAITGGSISGSTITGGTISGTPVSGSTGGFTTLSSNAGTTLTGLPSSGNTLLLGIDGSGVVSTTAIPATITADNGLTKTGSNIQLGGALTQNTTVAGGNFNTTFTGTNNATGTATLKVQSAPGTVAGGSELFASDNRISATSTGAQTTLRAQYNNAQSNSDNVRVNGSLNEASAGGKGLGASGTPQATGVTGLADYTGGTDANATDFIVGVRGAAYTASNKTNGLNVVGMNFGGTYNSSVGGYFYPSNGTSNLGTVSQVGGTDNSAWQDATFAGKNVAVVAMDGSAAAPMTIAGTNRAIYANGNVQLSNLPATGNTALVGIDASGNLSTTAIPAAVTASNGLTRTGNDIALGGQLTAPTTVDQNAKPLIINNGNVGFGNTSTVQYANQPAFANVVEVLAENVGNVSAEQSQGINVLGSTTSAKKFAIANRGRLEISGAGVVAQARGMNGVVNIDNGGSIGPVAGSTNNTATGGYFNANLNAAGTLANSSTMTGVSADAQINNAAAATSGSDNSNILIGGRFGANYDGAGTVQTAARTIGVYGAAASSTTGNIGVLGTSNTKAVAGLPANINAGVAALSNPAATGGMTDLAIYSSGNVRMNGLPSTGNTALLGIDGSGNLSTTAIPATITADNGLTKTGSNIQLGGALTQNTTVAGGNFNTTFTSTNNATGTATLKVQSVPGAVAGGSELFASDNRISATSTGAQTTLRAQYNNAQSNSNNVRVNGSLNEASAGGTGLGAGGTPQATGVTGLADYTGAIDAPATDFIVGVRGAAYTATNKTNGLNVVGMNFGGTYNSSVGGYFFPSNGTSNLGTVSQIGGAENAGWNDATFNGKNVAMVAMDATVASPMAITGTNRAIYANGNVQLSNLPATGSTALVGIDANGNLSTTAVPATITASNGAIKVGDDIQVNPAFGNTFTAAQTFSGGAAITGGSIGGSTITGGTISGTPVSGSTGGFTTLSSSGAATLNSVSIPTTLGVTGNTTLAGLTAGATTLGATTASGITNTPISGSTGSFTMANSSTSTEVVVSNSGALETRTLGSLGLLNAVNHDATLTGNGSGTQLGIDLANPNTFTGAQTFNGGASATTLGTSGLATLNSATVTNTTTLSGTTAIDGAAVTLPNVPSTGATVLVGRDGSNQLVTTAIPAAITASNGVQRVANDIQLDYAANNTFTGLQSFAVNNTQGAALISSVNGATSATVNAARIGNGLTDVQVDNNLTIASTNAGSFNISSAGTPGLTVTNLAAGGALKVNGTTTLDGLTAGATTLGATTASGITNTPISGSTGGFTATGAGVAITTTAASTGFALQSTGPVRLSSLTATPTLMLGVDGSGNVGTAAIPTGGTVTASNGLTAASNNVTLGGQLSANTTVDLNSKTLTINNGSTTISGLTTGALVANGSLLANNGITVQTGATSLTVTGTGGIVAGTVPAALGTTTTGTVTASGLVTANAGTKTTGFITAITTKAANYTATANDYTILMNPVGSGNTVTLPAGVAGRMYTIKKINNNAGTVTVTPTGGNIEGGASYIIPATQNKYITIQSDGTDWYIIANN